MEAMLLGLFMISACSFGVLLDHPDSPAQLWLPDPFARRILTGIAMGLTAMGLIYSPWGKQSGAHMNPSITLTFLRLGKVKPWDALFYVLAQFCGGLAGVLLAHAVWGMRLEDSHVNFAVTVPGASGTFAALAGEAVIAFLMMSMVLFVSNAKSLAKYTGVFAGFLVAIYIVVEAPISGMSMNPARTLGSAFPSGNFTALWIYFLAPPAAMLLAGELRGRVWGGPNAARCAKLLHTTDKRCIFCGYGI